MSTFKHIIVLLSACVCLRQVISSLIPLPVGVRTEGVAHVTGSNFLAGDVVGGNIYLVDVTTKLITTAVRAPRGRSSVGLYTKGNYIFAAGGLPFGFPGLSERKTAQPTILVYDLTTGKEVTACTLPESGFMNDVTADKDYAYYTDSSNAHLHRLSLSNPSDCNIMQIPLPKDLFAGEGFRANGIVKYKAGLIVANIRFGSIYYVDLKYGNKVTEILPEGSAVGADGMDIVHKAGKTFLYIAQNRVNLVSEWKVRLEARVVSLKKIRDITNVRQFTNPTTVAIGNGVVFVPNFNFSTGVMAPPGHVFTLAAVPL